MLVYEGVSDGLDRFDFACIEKTFGSVLVREWKGRTSADCTDNTSCSEPCGRYAQRS